MKVSSVVLLGVCFACSSGEVPPTPDPVFTGDFVLARESDWPGGQACQYMAAMDQTVCSWGRLSVSVDSFVQSVFGTDIHQGSASGPVVHRDSINYAVRVGVGNQCTVFVAGTVVKPNGPGILGSDSLQFAGYDLLGDSVRWVYTPVLVRQPQTCN